MSGSPAALVLDSHGVTEAARGAEVVRALMVEATLSGAPVVVSAVTLAEVLRGHPRDAAIHLLLKGCRVEPVSREVGREAGELLGRTGRKDTVDAVVVATAATMPGRVVLLTSDPVDLRALAVDLPAVEIRRV